VTFVAEWLCHDTAVFGGKRRLREVKGIGGSGGRTAGLRVRSAFSQCVSPPVAPQRNGARFDRAIDRIKSHNQRLERILCLAGLSRSATYTAEHGAPAHATQSRGSREPRHPNPLPQGERAHGRTASSPLAEGERNGVTGKRAQISAQRRKAAVATAPTVKESPAGRPAAAANGINGHWVQ
jgi:hypothetical protein